MPAVAKNRVKMTDLWVRKIATKKDREEWLDTAVSRLTLRVYASGRKSWYLRYSTRGGVERRLGLGDYPTVGLSEARDAAKREQGKVSQGADPRAERAAERAGDTFGALALLYMEYARREKRTWPEDERMLGSKDLRALHKMPLREIRRAEIAKVLDPIVRRGAPIMANRVRALLSKMFSYAVELQLLDFSPIAGLRKPAAEQKRDRVLRDDELAALWKVWQAEASTMTAGFRVLLLTGQRSGEVFGMRWVDVDLPCRTWTIPSAAAKNKRAHRVHLAPPVLAILEELRPVTGGSPWVFESPRRPGCPITSINKVAGVHGRRAGVTDWHPHDLRRTAATGMVLLGTAEPVVGAVLNHSPRGVTAAVYIRAGYAREAALAWEAWAAHVAAITARAPAPEGSMTAPAASRGYPQGKP